MASATVKTKIKETQAAFQDVVWPLIRQPFLGGGSLIPVEAVTDRTFAKDYLDTCAGIDSWQVIPDKGKMRGLATRCQWTRRLFPTFTIRYSRETGRLTEYAKRRSAIEEGGNWLRPSVIIQAYFAYPRPSHELRAVAIAYLDDVILTIRDGQQGNKGGDQKDWYLDETNPERWAETDRTGFAVVPIATLKRLKRRCDWLDEKWLATVKV